jgi:hypothetical protein
MGGETQRADPRIQIHATTILDGFLAAMYLSRRIHVMIIAIRDRLSQNHI